MKALTVWQPWASLIMAGAKPYEFRSWRPPRSLIGQRIVIHAATRPIDRVDAAAYHNILAGREFDEELRTLAAETCLIPEKAIPVLLRAWMADRDPLPLAAGLGTAILGEPRLGTLIAAEFGVSRANDSDRDEHVRWGWPLTDIEVWPEPIPMSGRQGFWNWPTPEEAGL